MTKVLVLIACSLFGACADRDLKVDFFRAESSTFSWKERYAIERIARATVTEVRPLLPTLPPTIELTVRPVTDVIEETGETASAMPPNAIIWTVDPNRPGGVDEIAQKWLRASLF